MAGDNKKYWEKRCGAQTKTQQPCRQWKMPNGKCYIHGGLEKDPIKHIAKHFKYGLYADVGLHEYEKGFYKHVHHGDLIEELTMVRVRLRRVYKAQQMWELQYSGFLEDNGAIAIDGPDEFTSKFLSLTQVEVIRGYRVADDGRVIPVDTQKLVKKKEDYLMEIRQLTTLISNLEMKQKELSEGKIEESMFERLVIGFRDFSDDAMASLPGRKM